MSKKLQSDLMLLVTAIIWGSSFVAQRAGMDYIGPFTFNCIRTLLGALVLVPVIYIIIGQQKKAKDFNGEEYKQKQAAMKKPLIIGGICCGIALFVGSTLQQIGISYTTAGKAGFITALYIVIVPILGIFLGKKVKPMLWICVAVAMIGLYMLTVQEGFSIQKGDLLVLVCAVGFAFHILIIDHFSPKVDGVKLSAIQFLVTGLMSVPFMLIFETVELESILQCWLPILYAGVLSCGVAYTLQVVAQKHAEPTVASLILSSEAVFAVIGGILLLNETISYKEFLGIALMFIAIVIAQLPSKKERLCAKQQR